MREGSADFAGSRDPGHTLTITPLIMADDGFSGVLSNAMREYLEEQKAAKKILKDQERAQVRSVVGRPPAQTVS